MKKKSIAHSLILFLVLGLFYFIFSNSKNSTVFNPMESEMEEQEIVASAITDSVNDITRVPALQAGVVKKILVGVGQQVKKGQTLMILDDTLAKQALLVHTIGFKQAQNHVAIQEKNIHHLKNQLHILQSMDKRAVSRNEIKEKLHEIRMGSIQLSQLQHGLDLAKANLKNAELALSQFRVLAPKAGIVLQISIHLNEYAGAAQPMVLLGDAKKVMVRVSIDERDAQHFNSKADAYLTSNDTVPLKIPLKFVQLDRYIITQERLNSRVQEALYYFDRTHYANLPAGQQFDAHISMKTS